MLGLGERKAVSRFWLLPVVRAGESPSIEAQAGKDARVEQRDERPELPYAMFRPSIPAGEYTVTSGTVNPARGSESGTVIRQSQV
jgi:hypothetical protein